MFINKYDDGKLLRTDIDLNAINIFQSWIDFWQVTFRASLGDFEDNWKEPKYFFYADWMYFLIAMLILIIVMLNLLVSIVTNA